MKLAKRQNPLAGAPLFILRGSIWAARINRRMRKQHYRKIRPRRRGQRRARDWFYRLAIAFVAAAGGDVHNGANITFNLDCTGCDAVVMATAEHTGTTTSLSATLGGAAMTLEVSAATAGDACLARIFSFASPGTGNQSIVVTGSDASIRAAARACGYSGVDTSNVIGTTNTGAASAGSTAPTLNFAPSGLAFGAISWRTTAANQPTITDPYTSRGTELNANLGGVQTAASESATGFATGTPYTLSASAGWSTCAAEINAASGGGGPVNVTPDVGVLTATGFASTVQTPRNVTPGLGEVTASGFAPAIQTPVSSAPDAGSVVATGFEPTVQTPVNISPDVGTATLVGFAPTVSLPVTVTTGFGQAVVTGFAPTVQTPITVSTDVGTATLTGFAPAILTPAGVTPGTGLLTVIGFAPTLGNAISVEPGLGELSATGLAPTVQTTTSAAPDTGLLTVTGFAPTITLPANVSAGFGELIATGFQPTIGDVLVNIVIDPFVLNLSPTMTVRNLSPTGTARNVSPTVVARRK